MSLRALRSPLVAASFLIPALLGAQTPTVRPTPQQAQVLLQTRPDLVAQLRQRFATAGMSKEQVHARLRAEGYPEDILDAYLPGATGDAAAPGPTALRAIEELGIADSAELSGSDPLGTSGAPRREMDILQRAQSPFRPDTIRDAAARDSVLRLVASADSGFVIFGLDVFRASTSQFQPNSAGPVDAGYRLGPGDRLVLILTGDVEQSYALDVTREGFIVIPQVGQIYVNNLTLGDLDALLYQRLGRVYSGVRRGGGSTRFSVNVARLRSNQVFVAGDVQRPGSYTVSSAGTALTALYAAGGPTANGTLRHIEIKRGGRTVDALDVYDYLLRGDASHDVRLQSGDIIFVPVHGPRARVVGEVIRPATYELRPGESLAQLIEASGGFTALAAQRRLLIERIVPASERTLLGHERITVDVASTGLVAGQLPAASIQNGDVVRVFAVADRVRNRISVLGNVNTPGAQGITPGMRVADALRAAGGVKADSYLGEVLVTRLQSDSTRIQLRARLRDTTGAVLDDFPLQEDDQIQVFSLTAFRPIRYVAVVGFVNRPGRYPFREGMTLRDLVLLGGGMKEGASLREAEIARLPVDRSGGVTAVTIRVPLDSSFVFERRAGVAYNGPPGQQAAVATAPDVPLEPYDNVLILRQENFEYQRTVTLGGEVRFPGAYALKNKRERLSDLITRAGGLTEEAQSDAISFTRRGSIASRISSEIATTRVQDSLITQRATNGRIGLDLAAVLRDPSTRENLVLEDGDEIVILRYNPIVRVQGAVNAPSNVAYVPGRDIHYYIAASGGSARDADEDRSYVTQSSGKLESIRGRGFLMPKSVPVPSAGAVVTVPVRDPADRKDFTAIVATVSQIVASLVAVIAISRR